MYGIPCHGLGAENVSSGISLLSGSEVLLHGLEIVPHGGEDGMLGPLFIVVIRSIPVRIVGIRRAADGGDAQEVPRQLEQVPARQVGWVLGPDGEDLAGADGDSALATGQTRTPALVCQPGALEDARRRVEAGRAISGPESCRLEPVPLDDDGAIIWAAQRLQSKPGIVEPVADLVAHRDAVLRPFRLGEELIRPGPSLALFFAPQMRQYRVQVCKVSFPTRRARKDMGRAGVGQPREDAAVSIARSDLESCQYITKPL